MWREMERSPVLAAPGSNNYSGLIASSTSAKSGSEACEFQGDTNDLCERYMPLAYKLASKYRDRGLDLDELRSAALTGLILASRRFDPQRGAFGSYAKFWIRGELTALFKKSKTAPLDLAEELDAPLSSNKPEGFDRPRTPADKLAYQPPIIAVDLIALSDTDRQIVQARDAGETLAKIGKVHDLSAERVRQREARARRQIKGAVASACVSDLTRRGEVLPYPGRYSLGDSKFLDRPPFKHAYREPQPSQKLAHHRTNAQGLADLRGNEPLRNPRGPYGGPVIHAWGRQ